MVEAGNQRQRLQPKQFPLRQHCRGGEGGRSQGGACRTGNNRVGDPAGEEAPQCVSCGAWVGAFAMSLDNRPQTIQIFLPFGDPQGIRTAENTTRTVHLIEVPRSLRSEEHTPELPSLMRQTSAG